MDKISDYRKCMCIGPGGIKCGCCFPAPGSASRKHEYKSIRRKIKSDTNKAIQEHFINKGE